MENEKKNFFEETKDLVADYVDDKLQLIKLQVAEKAAIASASVVKVIVISVMAYFIWLIITFLAGYYLSRLTGSYGIGFGIVAMVYLLLIFVFSYYHKKSWNKKIADKVVSFIFSQNK